MSNVNITSDVNIIVDCNPIDITVNQLGIQGIQGLPGASSTGSSSNAGVSSLNLLTGLINLSGQNSVTVFLSGQTIFISGYSSSATGNFLTSGQAVNLFYPLNNPSGFITGLNTGNFISTSQTGQFYPLSNPLNFISSTGINLSNIVYQSGYQIISGLKSFTTGISVSYISGNSNYIGLIDNNGFLSNDWVNRSLNDTQGIESISYDIRVLRDAIQNYSVEYGNRFLRDAAQNYVLDWNNRNLSGNWTKDNNFILTSLDSGNLQNQINLEINKPTITGISIFGAIPRVTGDVIFSAGNDIQLGQSTNGITIISTAFSIASGTNLQNQINLINSGTGNFYLNSNISGFITGLSTGNFISNNQTGAFYSTSNLQQYIKSGDVSSIYSTILNLGTTGQNLYNLLINESGQFNLTGSNLSNSIFNTGNQLWNITNNNGINISGNLFSTGSNLQNQINTLTTNLALTGQNDWINLNNNSLNLSGNLALTGQNLWLITDSNSRNISGNLTQTGVIIENQIISLSGYLNTQFVDKLSNQSITGIKTFISNSVFQTGSGVNFYVQGNAVLTGIVAGTNITVQNNNGNFTINSTAAGGGTNITGLSISGGLGITGALNINAGANITLNQIGNNSFSIAASAGGGGASLINVITGSGTFNFITKFTQDNSGIINSNLIDSGTLIFSKVPLVSNNIRQNSGGLNINSQALCFAFSNFR